MGELWTVPRQRWHQWVQRWQEQPRLRLAGWIILALLVIDLVGVCADWKGARQQEYTGIAEELRKMHDLARQSYWPERAVQAEDRLAQFRAHLWQAQNTSLARADVQSWLDIEIRKAGVMEPRVTVLDPVDFNDGKPDPRIEVQVRGSFDPTSYGRLLLAIEGAERWISIERVELSNGVSPSINLQLAFHWALPGKAP
ncbi:hypothetical protein ACYCAX_11125 [Pseudomonas sp. MT3]